TYLEIFFNYSLTSSFLLQNHMLIIWKIFCILLLSLGAFGIGLGISYLDFFLFFIGLLFLLCFFLALKQAREDAGSFPDE
ncbi:hypothetical protein ABNIH22_18373, partial [Acinetobacter baumannii ABNIH22]